METKRETTEYKVAPELFADVLRILFKNKIAYGIVGIKTRTNTILLKVDYRDNDKLHGKAKENIETLLSDFSEYMEGLTDAVLYSEESE